MKISMTMILSTEDVTIVKPLSNIISKPLLPIRKNLFLSFLMTVFDKLLKYNIK